MLSLNNILLNSQWVIEEIKEKIKNTLKHENITTIFQNLWDAAKAVLKREVDINVGLPQETRTTSNEQSNFTPKRITDKNKA